MTNAELIWKLVEQLLADKQKEEVTNDQKEQAKD